MLKLNNINLARTNSYYQSDTFKGLLTQTFTSSFKSFINSRKTEFFLNDVSFEVAPGERIALIGSNGSGKSSLCRIIAGQLFSTSGALENSFKVSLFSQIETAFYKELSGRENLKFFIKFLYADESSEQQLIYLENAISFSELGAEIDRQLETYSLGMISRLALSLILCKKHDLLILDEIHSHADFAFRKKVADQLKNIIDASQAVIVVSHQIDELAETCERGLLLENGKVIFDGNIQKAIACYKLKSSRGPSDV